MKHSAISALILFSGCNLTPPVSYVHVCPVAPTYSRAFEAQAGQQLAQLPATSPIVKMIEDYLAVRQEIKDCR
jgi:hypothetical protein